MTRNWRKEYDDQMSIIHLFCMDGLLSSCVGGYVARLILVAWGENFIYIVIIFWCFDLPKSI